MAKSNYSQVSLLIDTDGSPVYRFKPCPESFGRGPGQVFQPMNRQARNQAALGCPSG